MAGTLGAIALVAITATGWVEVAPGEVVVVRRLGRILSPPWTPGPHLGWPLGLDRIDRTFTPVLSRRVFSQATVSSSTGSRGEAIFEDPCGYILRLRIAIRSFGSSLPAS